MATIPRDWLIGSLVHVVAWFTAYGATLLLLSGTSAVLAYGLLSAWWFALYADYVMGVKLKVAVVLFVGCFALSVGSRMLGVAWLISERTEDLGVMLPVLAAGQALVFASPVIVSSLTQKIVAFVAGDG